jgi:protein-disulfide isomerase
MVKAGSAKPGQIMNALAQRDHALRLGQDRIGEAEQAFQDAQTHEAEAGEAAGAAAAALDHAEEQFQRVVEMRASPGVVRTVQLELDEAQAARETANQAQRAAKGELSEASRALARTKAALDRLVSEIVPPPIVQTETATPMPYPVELDEPVEPLPNPGVHSAVARQSEQAVSAPKSVTALWAAIAAAAVVVILIGAFLQFHGSGPSPAPANSSGANPAIAAANPASTVAPQAKVAIDQYRQALERDPRDFVANPTGAITVTEFYDYRCPHCINAAPAVLSIIHDNPDVRFVFKEFPIFGAVSEKAAAGAIAVKKAGGDELGLYRDLMAARPLDETSIDPILRAHHVDPASLDAPPLKQETVAQLQAVRELATNLGVQGTPAFIVGGTMIPGDDTDALHAAIAAARKSHS